jgi:TRAP-type C4-dicarboxylate transport system permease small subunit
MIDELDQRPLAKRQLTAGQAFVVRCRDTFDWLEKRILLPIGVITLTALMILVTLDATLRYLLGGGMLFLSEINAKIAMPLLVFLALAGLAAGRGHVAVDLFTSRYPPVVKRTSNAVFDLLGALFLALIVFEFARRAESAGGGATTSFVIPEIYSFAIVIVGCALGALRFIVMAVQEIIDVPQPQDEDVDADELAAV